MRCLLLSGGMRLRLGRRLCLGPPLLLLGLALGLFYQSLNVSPEIGAEEDQSLSFFSVLDKLQAQAEYGPQDGPQDWPKDRPRAGAAGAPWRTALVLTGHSVSSDSELQLYLRLLRLLGFKVQLSRYAQSSALLRTKTGVREPELLLCLSSSQSSCLRRLALSPVRGPQKVNLLPQLLKAFSDAGDGLCHMFTVGAVEESKLPMRTHSCGPRQKHRASTGADGSSRAVLSAATSGAELSVYVLVSSVQPLTSFLHHTVVLKAFGEKKGQTYQLHSLRVADVDPAAAPDVDPAAAPDVDPAAAPGSVAELIKSVIGDMLQAATSTPDAEHATNRCLLCYQLLTFTLLFDGPLKLSVVQVDTDWTFSALDAETFDREITKDLMLEDMLSFLLRPPSVTKAASNEDDARALGVSLSEDDLQLLLHFYRLMKSPGPFEPVFTSTALCSASVRPQSVTDLLIRTACLHELQQNNSLSSIAAESLGEIGHTQDFTNQQNVCVDPRLRQIYTDPPLPLSPAFDPRVKEYRVEVPFDTVMVRIRPQPFSSHCHVHLDERHGPSVARLPLGLGLSRVSVLVTDGAQAEAVLTVYTLHVFRESRPSLPMFGEHVLCSFTQECGLQVQPERSCGLEPFNQTLSPPAACSSGDTPGRWVVPCLNCHDNRTCDWREIVWQPDDCHHLSVSRLQLQDCVADTKLLFIGDSTNRGMMYFLMERVNSSLQDWEKAHDTLLYRNVNAARTLLAYSYYPQFWLEAEQRPTFFESLEALLDRSQPLSNSRRTVLVVGGVQWLNTNHLRVIRDTLDRKGLSNALVVVKSLGMGFHLNVDGIRSLRLTEIQELFRENQNLIAEAKKFGFEVIDTFSITMGRYKEFLQGRCACHFHEVEKHVSSRSPSGLVPQSPAVPYGTGPHSSFYKVKGPVNQVYSEILLSRLCFPKHNSSDLRP